MKDEAARILIEKIAKTQNWVDTLIEALEKGTDTRIVGFKKHYGIGERFHVGEGIEKIAKLYGEKLHFEPVNYQDDDIGNVYFIHEGRNYFMIVNQAEKDALLGGDAE